MVPLETVPLGPARPVAWSGRWLKRIPSRQHHSSALDAAGSSCGKGTAARPNEPAQRAAPDQKQAVHVVTRRAGMVASSHKLLLIVFERMVSKAGASGVHSAD